MVASITIRVDFNHLSGAGGKLKSGLTAAVTKTVFDVQRLAQGYAPVDTGALRGSISASAGGMQGQVNSGVEYAIYQEYGTRYQSGTPHMRPAAEAGMGPFIAAVTAAVNGIA